MKTSLNSAEIKKIFLTGNKKNFDKISLIKKEDDVLKFAVIVSKKFIKSAVKRNYIKRVARDLIRNNLKPARYILIYSYKEFEPFKVKQYLKQIF